MHKCTVNLKTYLHKRKLSFKRGMIRWHYHKWLYPSVPPDRVRIDASTICQLRCEGCGFQRNNHRDLGGGFLTLDRFRQFLDANPDIKIIELSNYGEVLLNPEIIDIIRYAFEKDVALEARMGMNFNTVTDEHIRALVDYQFRFISLSIDGASQASYARYRIGGSFETVINNIKRLQAYKRKQQSKYPIIQWQYVLTQYNELDIGKAKEIAKDLDIPIYFKLNFMPSYQPVHEDYIREQTGLDCLTREEYADKYHKPYLGEYCLQMFINPQINWDGKLLGCGTNEYGFQANVFEDGLMNSLRSPDYVKAKEFLLMKDDDPDNYADVRCRKCKIWETRIKYGLSLELPKRGELPFYDLE